MTASQAQAGLAAGDTAQRRRPFCADIAAMAHKAMLMEVGASPKPGLVCPDHNGSHKDMDHALFAASADSLLPYLRECADLGRAHPAMPPEELFPLLREAGCRAEKAMFTATNGVNTHKGLIFSLGLLCAACGRALASDAPFAVNVLPPETIARDAAAFVRGIVARDLEPLKKSLPDRKLTAGEKLYLEHGTAGIRQEAEQGFPAAIAAYQGLYYCHQNRPLADILPEALLRLMVATEDTNILWRGGQEGLAYAREEAQKALDLGGMDTDEGRTHIFFLRDEFPRRNLSPGGCADLLALAIFFLLLRQAEE